MIAKRSPLVLDRFEILDSSCRIIPSDDPEHNLMDATKEMPVDIDFAIQEADNGSQIYIFVKAGINNVEKQLSGYSISAEGVGVFSFDSSVTEAEKKTLVNSGVNIAITNLRAYINTMTSFYPLGHFSFHSVDMPALFKSKVDKKL